MKFGFSLSSCVMDIYEGKVDESDVFLIQSGTLIKDSTNIPNMVYAYVGDGRMWGDQNKLIEIVTRLYISGKVYEPRAAHHRPIPIKWNEHWADLSPTVDTQDETVKKAWQQYRMLLGLTSDEQPKTPAHLRKVDSSDKTIGDNF